MITKRKLQEQINALEKDINEIKASLYYINAPKAVWNEVYDYWMFIKRKKKHKINELNSPLLGNVDIIVEEKAYADDI